MHTPITHQKNQPHMAKKDYKETILIGVMIYRVWRAMFEAKCKSEKL